MVEMGRLLGPALLIRRQRGPVQIGRHLATVHQGTLWSTGRGRFCIEESERPGGGTARLRTSHCAAHHPWSLGGGSLSSDGFMCHLFFLPWEP